MNFEKFEEELKKQGGISWLTDMTKQIDDMQKKIAKNFSTEKIEARKTSTATIDGIKVGLGLMKEDTMPFKVVVWCENKEAAEKIFSYLEKPKKSYFKKLFKLKLL